MDRGSASVTMVISLILTVSVLQMGFPSHARTGVMDTYVENNITENTTWDSDGSPYQINGTLTVAAGATLTIEDDVMVRMDSDSSLIVRGSLVCGVVGGVVRFLPLHGDSWLGLVVENNGSAEIESTGIRSAELTVNMSGGEASIKNSTLIDCDAVAMLNHSSRLVLQNTSFDPLGISVQDSGSRVLSLSMVDISLVDIYGDPEGPVDIDIYDHKGILVHEAPVNDSGEMPATLLQGFTYTFNGTNRTTGKHLVVMRDVPFTHFVNETMLINGSFPQSEQPKFSWPPEMTNIPDRFFAYEDQIHKIPSKLLDRNDVGSLDLNISSDHVTYDHVYEELNFVYEDENVSGEVVYLNLSDGYDRRSYTIDVEIVFRDDAPVFRVPYTLLYVREDTPYSFDVEVSDEDTKLADINFSSDDPGNITFDTNTTSFILDYGDGTPAEFTVDLSVSDGTTRITKQVIIFFEPVYYAPYFKEPFPEITLDEDSWVMVNLTDLVGDPDEGDKVDLMIRVEDYDLMAVHQNGKLLNISSLRDSNGEGRILLTLVDSMNLSTSRYLNVTIEPVNDPPKLTMPEADHRGGTSYRFNVTYTDIDGDIPPSVSVIVDGISYEMSPSADGELEPRTGLLYYAVIDIPPGNHTYYFNCTDGESSANTSTSMLRVEHPVNIVYLEGHDGWLNITVWYTGSSTPTLEKNPHPEEMLGLEEVVLASFSVEPDGSGMVDVFVMVWVDKIDPRVMPEYSRLVIDGSNRSGENPALIYNTGDEVLSFSLEGSDMTSEIAIISLLDPSWDSDGDSFPDINDMFPDDPSEWIDTDMDGIGDNSDNDDDGDGYNDTLEIDAGTDPLSSYSYPVDTDGDGVLDFRDDDDDGDGIPDSWERDNGLDPGDPTDADMDLDGDGRSNLEEYLDGTDPAIDPGNGGGDSDEFPSWLLMILILVLVLLVVAGIIIFVLANRKVNEELSAGEDWSVRGELDAEDAVECPECDNVYPLSHDECPFCGKPNPYDEDVEE